MDDSQSNINQILTKEIGSLNQQITILSIFVGAALKELSLTNQNSSKKILEDSKQILDAIREQITSDRAQQLRNLLDTALLEGIKNGRAE